LGRAPDKTIRTPLVSGDFMLFSLISIQQKQSILLVASLDSIFLGHEIDRSRKLRLLGFDQQNIQLGKLLAILASNRDLDFGGILNVDGGIPTIGKRDKARLEKLDFVFHFISFFLLTFRKVCVQRYSNETNN